MSYNSKTKYAQVGYNRLNLKKRHIYLPFLYRHLLRQRRYQHTQKQYLEIDASQGLFSDSYDEAVKFIAGKSYDLIIVGSDTVLNFYEWNFSQNELPIYWLPPDLGIIKVMLASSIGTDLTLDSLDAPILKALAHSAECFEMLAVRDKITQEFLLELVPQLKSRIGLVPDPTFSYQVDTSHADRYLKRCGIDQSIPLIGLDLPLNVPGTQEAIQHFKSKGYRIVSWRGGTKVSDYDFSDMTPFQWAGMFANYNLTLTNRFHASIFSLKNLTPVIALDCKPERVTASRRSKISLLLEDFGLRGTNYCNATHLTDKKWILQTMESTLAEPQTELIIANLSSMKCAYEVYLSNIADLPCFG